MYGEKENTYSVVRDKDVVRCADQPSKVFPPLLSTELCFIFFLCQFF